MIEMIPQPSVDLIGEALRSHLAVVVEATPDCVRFKHEADGHSYVAEIHMNENWGRVECDLGAPSASRASGQLLFKALEWNVQLTGAARFAINEKSFLCVQSEFPLGFETGLNAVIGEMLSSVGDAVLVARGLPAPDRAARPQGGPAGDSTGELDLVALCDEAGWLAKQRPGGLVTVGLEAPGSHYAAELRVGDSEIIFTVGFSLPETLSSASRQASVLLALSAGGLVRWVRTQPHTSGGETMLGFTVRCVRPPTPQEIANALGCLSVICQLGGEEFKALHHEAAAREYLAIRRWSVPEVDPQPPTQERNASS